MNNRNFEISLSRMSDAQSTYQKAYIVLANYMTGIRKTTLNTSYLPADKQSDAKQCYDAIQEVVSDYARTIGSDLKNVPTDMLNQMSKIINRLPNAIEAASRLNRGEGSQEDYAVVYKVLHDSLRFAKAGIENCEIMIDNVNTFINGKGNNDAYLKVIEDNANSLVKMMADSSKDYHSQIANLQKMIDDLNKEIRNLNNAEIGTGVGVGVFLALGVCVIGAMVTGGAGAPLITLAIGVMGVALAAGGIAFGFETSQVHKLQAMIDEYGKEIDVCNAAIFQLDLMSQSFSGMVNSLDEVKNALNTIKAAWEALETDMNELLDEVEQAENDYDSEVWDSVVSELNTITNIFNDKIKVKVEAMDISNIVVSDATYDFTLSNEEVQKMYDQSEKIDFVRYLRTA